MVVGSGCMFSCSQAGKLGLQTWPPRASCPRAPPSAPSTWELHALEQSPWVGWLSATGLVLPREGPGCRPRPLAFHGTLVLAFLPNSRLLVSYVDE